ncbi:MAG: hypothetical protein KKD73_03575 [Proteobacteria bacterium]|nr:hypothetical protein [Pseudomonadota bacterium]MBU1640575.1 hypothetical protein [Pseudomonadota bacterium]
MKELWLKNTNPSIGCVSFDCKQKKRSLPGTGSLFCAWAVFAGKLVEKTEKFI